MGEMFELTAADGHRLSVYCAIPDGPAKGGLIVGQELFGVNAHIRRIADLYARHGYFAAAPCFYDRVQRGFSVGYSPAELELARTVLPKLTLDGMLLDCDAALRLVRVAGRVGMVGYCSGGSAAWAAGQRLDGLACAVSYYGGWIAGMADKPARVPVMLHWGVTDHTIPMADVRSIEARRPEVESHVYEAGHGFNCEMRSYYDAAASALALERTLAFLALHVDRPGIAAGNGP